MYNIISIELISLCFKLHCIYWYQFCSNGAGKLPFCFCPPNACYVFQVCNIHLQITDRGVCHFLENATCCPNLVQLSLCGTSITDDSLAAMSGQYINCRMLIACLFCTLSSCCVDALDEEYVSAYFLSTSKWVFNGFLYLLQQQLLNQFYMQL